MPKLRPINGRRKSNQFLSILKEPSAHPFLKIIVALIIFFFKKMIVLIIIISIPYLAIQKLSGGEKVIKMILQVQLHAISCVSWSIKEKKRKDNEKRE